MIEIAALVLCKLGGKAGSAEEIKAVLLAAGIEEPSEESITTLLTDVGEKDLNTLLASGMELIKDVPIGGSG
jgi:large subunit ribosomal protein LP2